MSLPTVRPAALPDGALLHAYRKAGAYTDCFATEVPRAVSHEQYVAAFYTTAVFKAERCILKYAIGRPSSDAQARQLAAGSLDRFAAWNVERRAPDQIVLRAYRTRSWLMVAPNGSGTRLFFGSAVEPRRDSGRLGLSFGVVLVFHKLYSRILLHAARRRLLREPPP